MKIKPIVLFGIIWGLLAIVFFVLQIIYQNETTTKLETVLINMLQFIFSVGFAYTISSYNSQGNFQKNQKKFAIAAFRRINEIDMCVERLIDRVKGQIDTSEEEDLKELEIVHEIASNIRYTIKSSISDWTDLIGEELNKIKEIDRFEKKKEDLLKQKENSIYNIEVNQIELAEKVNNYETQIQKLLTELPVSLKSLAKEKSEKEKLFEEKKQLIREIIEHKGEILLSGFSEEGYFKSDISKFKVGDKLLGRIADDESTRVGVLVLFDSKGNSVGMIMNKFHIPYFNFVKALTTTLGTSLFEAEITEIGKLSKTKRQHFKVKIEKQTVAN